MPWRLLIDENTADEYDVQLLRHRPDIEIRHVGKSGAPELGTQDPDILCWCEDHNFMLLTANRRSMPGHPTNHLALGRHIPGILIIWRRAEMGQVVRSLVNLFDTTDPEKYIDIMVHIPRL